MRMFEWTKRLWQRDDGLSDEQRALMIQSLQLQVQLLQAQLKALGH